jgi:nucleoside 2-deoxyribosyltransferase
MKIFITYKFAGENPKELEMTLVKIADALKKEGHIVYSAFLDEELFAKNRFTLKQILNHALKEIDSCDCIFIFARSNEKTEGMLLEIGYALAKKKKIILAAKEGVSFQFTEEIADIVIEFKDIDDLLNKLKKLKV